MLFAAPILLQVPLRVWFAISVMKGPRSNPGCRRDCIIGRSPADVYGGGHYRPARRQRRSRRGASASWRCAYSSPAARQSRIATRASPTVHRKFPDVVPRSGCRRRSVEYLHHCHVVFSRLRTGFRMWGVYVPDGFHRQRCRAQHGPATGVSLLDPFERPHVYVLAESAHRCRFDAVPFVALRSNGQPVPGRTVGELPEWLRGSSTGLRCQIFGYVNAESGDGQFVEVTQQSRRFASFVIE